MKMIGTNPMPNGRGGLTVSRDGRRLFVADLMDSVLHVIDTTTDREVRAVPLNAKGSIPVDGRLPGYRTRKQSRHR